MVKAIVFDFDGVLFDTEPLHFDMFRQVLRMEGISLAPEVYYARYVGLTDPACFRAVLADHGRSPASSETVARLVQCKTELMQASLRARLPAVPGVRDCVETIASRYRTAVASGALREEIALCLELAGMASMFEHVSAAQDVHQGKPAPALYLHALAALNRRSALRADECVAIEDTPHGIEAAHQAGMRCIAVATTLPESRLSAADVVVPSLQTTTVESLLHRLA